MKADQISGISFTDTVIGPLCAALAVLGAGVLILPFVEFGPVSAHMAVHIASMNVVAPLLAVALSRRNPKVSSAGLWIAAAAQLALLWGAHSPALHHAAQQRPILMAGLHVSLFLSAVAFWMAISLSSCSRWQAMLALLVSGKLACLLGALVIFSPRPLYAVSSSNHHVHGTSDVALMADQQLAGLLMIGACPLSYVLAAVVIAAQTIMAWDSEARAAPASGRRIPA